MQDTRSGSVACVLLMGHSVGLGFRVSGFGVHRINVDFALESRTHYPASRKLRRGDRVRGHRVRGLASQN